MTGVMKCPAPHPDRPDTLPRQISVNGTRSGTAAGAAAGRGFRMLLVLTQHEEERMNRTLSGTVRYWSAHA